MDYEQQYKEALEKLQEALAPTEDGCKISGLTRDYLENIFPELKESEDERIKREIVAYINELADLKNEKIPTKWLDWLEKQGEQPTDKVEPKFHEGDWVIHGYNILKIKCVGNTHYCFETVGGYVDDMLVSEIDSQFHLWTIQDAKDGDVLLEEETGEPFIYNGNRATYFSGYFLGAHCGIYNGKINPYGNNHYWGKNSCPATKEQRELLFQKMKEAGYEWDAEKKELKKIPNAFEECEIVHVEHGKYYYCIKDYYDGGNKRASKGDVVQALNGMSMMALGVKANEYFIPVNNIKQMYAWSEEDEKFFNDTIAFFENKNALDHMDWLKSLKERMQPPTKRWKNSIMNSRRRVGKLK